jgi:hypothetical protein
VIREKCQFNCRGNPIYEVYKFFYSHKYFIDSLDYNYLRGRNIVKSRFQEALDELNIIQHSKFEVPKSIPGYEYI